MVIRVYWASVTGNRKISGEQTRLRNLLQSLKITSEWIDITTDTSVKQKMREECGDPKAMPPQIFNDFRYLGSVEDLEGFVEEGKTREWLGVDDVTDVDGVVTSLTNGITTEEAAKEENPVETRLQDSPTSSIENDPTAAPNPPKNEPPPSRKAVLAAAGAFEAMLKEPPAKSNKSRVIFTQSRSLSTNQNGDTPSVDAERKLRILGLSNSENAATNNESSAR